MRLKFILLLLLLFCTNSYCTLDVYIDHKIRGMCNATSQRIVCPSIEHFTGEYSNHSGITIHISDQVHVAALAYFHNISDLTILGEHSQPKAQLVCLIGAQAMPCHQTQCSGFQFVGVQTLNITNVEIVGCGGGHLFRNRTIRSAIFISSCVNVFITNVNITLSEQSSLFIENTSGNVSLENVHIQSNILKEHTTKPLESFAGGAQIIFHESTEKSLYRIIDCQFYNITTPNYTEFDPRVSDDITDWTGYGLGGGISITFDEKSTKHSIELENCIFHQITAPWGAGMHVKILESSVQNSVTIKNTTFEQCTASHSGGGLTIGISHNQQVQNERNDNFVLIRDSNFRRNRAEESGAGTYIFAFYDNIPARQKMIKFVNCRWEENEGFNSPAVDISPSSFDQFNIGSLPVPVFKDCSFIRNTIIQKCNNYSKSITVGVFVIVQFSVIFEGTFYFEGNAPSALLLISGQIAIEPNSRLTFTKNKGLRGGAISLYGFSSIRVSDNCTLEFLNNTATEYGGAIYKDNFDMREFFAGRSCFLEYNGKRNTDPRKRNISFVFIGNAAPISGSSIFAASFYSCYFSNRGTLNGSNVADFLDDIGDFSFDELNRTCKCRGPALGTTESEFINEKRTNVITSIPGKRLFLPLSVKDELGQKYNKEFFTEIAQGNSSIHINGPYTINRSVEAYGFPRESANLIATTQHASRILQYTLVVKLLPCPPGYYFAKSDSVCKCSSDDSDEAFLGITKCNHDNFTAVLQSGYWAGYYNETLYVAVCPFTFCNLDTQSGQEFSLPNSREALSSFICQFGREGVLCGQCRRNYSTYYHSRNFACGKEDKCSYGIVLYIVSELVPVLIFFTLVVIFDISFTSGGRNGFVFFSQMVIILPHNYTKHSVPVQYSQTGYNLFYRIFNIDFFAVEQLSFCLFRNATVMDILAFKYITIVFAFILVMTVVVCANYCTCCKCYAALKKKVTATTSVLHGLSAFIVICYAECVRISFFILTQKTLLGAGGGSGPTVAFFSGIDYLKEKHIPYALPAIVSLGTIALIPPLLLLFYPSTLKVLQLCKLSEHRLVTATLRVTRINSLMPMFDVFQGCFKDNFRFFSGLYFLYRIAILAPYAFSVSLFQYAAIAEFILLLALGVHSIAQPYKLRVHNSIDSLLLLNLVVINGLTVILLKLPPEEVAYIIYTQFLLIYAPIVVFVIFYAVKLVKAVRNSLSKKVEDESEEAFLEHLDVIDRSANDSMEMSSLHLHSDYTQCDTTMQQ